MTGIIPALAGNTSRTIRTATRTWDHPRACGEHYVGGGDRANLEGSSPRLRGTPKHADPQGRFGGIIPALAGNTTAYASIHHTCKDHPRACGEHEPKEGDRFTATGSSPRLRGTLLMIVPVIGLPWDHPRAYGEHSRDRLHAGCGRGSSPRLRGTPRGLELDGQHRGIIPALTGNTCHVGAS